MNQPITNRTRQRDKTTMLHVRLRRVTHRVLKVRAAREGRALGAVVEDALHRYLARKGGRYGSID